MPDSAICSGVTGTCSDLPTVSPAPVSAHVMMTLRFTVTSSGHFVTPRDPVWSRQQSVSAAAVAAASPSQCSWDVSVDSWAVRQERPCVLLLGVVHDVDEDRKST